METFGMAELAASLGLRYQRQFVAYFHFVKWSAISLGVSLDLGSPNIEFHVPFGFIRIGFVRLMRDFRPINLQDTAWRQFGLGERHGE